MTAARDRRSEHNGGSAAPPPRLARWLIERIAPEQHREFVLGDLTEEHAELCSTRGPLRARLACWRQVLRCLGQRLRESPPRRRGRPRRPGEPMPAIALQDLRLAVRTHLRRPGLAAAIVAILALAIGSITAIFSAIDAVILRPLPFPRPAELVAVFDQQLDEEDYPASFPEFLDWRASGELAHLAAIARIRVTLTGTGDAESLAAYRTSAELFPMLGVEPVHGRLFDSEEEAGAGPDVVLVSWSSWQRRFGGDPSIVGRSLTLDGVPRTVIGILPEGFEDVYPAAGRAALRRELWLPLELDEEGAPRGLHFLSLIGRLHPGRTLEQTAAAMGTVAQRLRDEGVSRHGIALESLQDRLAREQRPRLLILAAAVGCVLLAACANVAGLLLARSAERAGEVAVRRALGAGSARLLIQLLLEGLVLTIAALPLGVALAVITVALLRGELPAYSMAVGGRALAFTAALGVATTLLFATMPALHAARGGRSASLTAGRDRLARAPRQRLRSALVVGEIALSLVLLVAAGLFGRSLHELLRTEVGFETGQAAAFDLELPRGRSELEAIRSFYRDVLAEVAAIPGIETAGLTSELPLDGGGTNGGVPIEGRDDPPESIPVAEKRIVSPGYFSALRIPLLAGRTPSADDVDGRPSVVVVSESFARRYFEGESPLGRRLAFSWEIDGWQEIVGVVGDVKHYTLDEEPEPTVYIAFEQRPAHSLTLVARTTLPLETVYGVVRERIAAIDPTVPVARPRNLQEVVATTVDDRRLLLALVGSFAAIALVLAATGLYGLASYSTRLRTPEIGLRLALGASPGAAFRLVVAQGVQLIALGLILGLIGAWSATRLIASTLYQVSPFDPTTLIGVCSTLAAVGLAACWAPARRAVRVDPAVALRDE
ncbi:MAG TPA: ADOP family duplicated permease [Thermoanaerobaculia bacterium]|nr:ADOP family duplicated permease [Thermoanaerobaculia bacterium]